jgi:hypothetical protein
MSRLAILLATVGLGLTLLSGSGFGLGRSAMGIANWASPTVTAAPARVPPVAPQNWASPRRGNGPAR